MNKDEFIKLCIYGGYSDKKTATEYCKGRDILNDSDLMAVHRVSQRAKHLTVGSNDKWRRYGGVKTTKKLIHTDI